MKDSLNPKLLSPKRSWIATCYPNKELKTHFQTLNPDPYSETLNCHPKKDLDSLHVIPKKLKHHFQTLNPNLYSETLNCHPPKGS